MGHTKKKYLKKGLKVYFSGPWFKIMAWQYLKLNQTLPNLTNLACPCPNLAGATLIQSLTQLFVARFLTLKFTLLW